MNEKIRYVLDNLPVSSGVYIMRDENKEIIYIGKAKNLKNRVRSYFLDTKKSLKTSMLVSNVDTIEYRITASEQDAFSLEANLIKQNLPKYNIHLKDDKKFPYIRIDKNQLFPEVTVSRKVKKDGALYFGPFVTGMRVGDMMEIIKNIFPIRKCKIQFERSKLKKRPCLYGDINNCTMPCVGAISNEEYLKIIDKVIDFLNGKNGEIKKALRKKMNDASEKQDFENAIYFRNLIEMLVKSDEKLITSLNKLENFDVFAICKIDDNVAINQQSIRSGKVIADRTFNIDSLETEPKEILQSFLIEYYSSNAMVNKIYTNIELEQSLAELLSSEYEKKIEIAVPKISTKAKIISQCEKNAREYLDKNLDIENRKNQMTKGALVRLADILKLDKIPYRLECYDISNISGTNSVSSMVVFEDGVPNKKEYRKFKIKTVEGPNDFASMAETIKRRFLRLKEKSENFKKIPDLVVIDGGLGQLHAAYQSMMSIGFNVPMISLAEKNEEIFTLESNVSIKLDKDDDARKLLQRIRDEAHRFAITFHRELRDKVIPLKK